MPHLEINNMARRLNLKLIANKLYFCVSWYVWFLFEQMRMVLFSMGFSITFGSLFSKTWRVYRIFSNKKLVRMVSGIRCCSPIGSLVQVVVVEIS